MSSTQSFQLWYGSEISFFAKRCVEVWNRTHGRQKTESVDSEYERKSNFSNQSLRHDRNMKPLCLLESLYCLHGNLNVDNGIRFEIRWNFSSSDNVFDLQLKMSTCWLDVNTDVLEELGASSLDCSWTKERRLHGGCWEGSVSSSASERLKNFLMSMALSTK